MERLLFETLESRFLLANVPAGFVDEQVTAGLHYVAGMTAMHDGRLLVCEQGGTLRVIKNGALLPQPMLAVAVDNAGERGLAHVAVDPEFDTNGYIYVWFTAPGEQTPNGLEYYNKLVRYTVSGDVANPASATLLFQTERLSIPIHNAGEMLFGPDGKLYFSHGHGWYGQEPQALWSTFGKILRINRDGTIPTDNPFFAETTGRNQAIWARGFRNPYTMAFRPGTNTIFACDVGNNSWEEVNEVTEGGNYGWPLYEGAGNDPNYTDPIYTYDHTVGTAVIGATFYTPEVPTFPAEYQDKFFFGDMTAGWIKVMDPDTHAVTDFASGISNFMVSMAVGSDGSFYYTTRDNPGENSTVRRVRYTESLAPQITDQPISLTVAAGEQVELSINVTGTGPFTYQWQKDSADVSGAQSSELVLSNVTAAEAGEYSCVVTNAAGSVTSDAAQLTVVTGTRPQITIVTPLISASYRAGDLITLLTTVTDLEDGILPATDVHWQVQFGHDTHVHPFIAPTEGFGGSFVIPDTGEPAPNVFYQIMVEATDSTGLTQTATARIDPLLSQITLAASIPGITLQLDGQPHAAPYAFSGVEGFHRLVSAPSTQEINGEWYQFIGWSNGGTQTQDITTPIDDTTITANYRKFTPVYLSDIASAFESNGLGPIERDTNNGAIAAGDGGPLKLNGQTFAKGLGMYAPAEIRFDLNKGYTRFFSTIGIDDIAGSLGSAYFEVWLDGERAYRSPLMNGITTSISLEIPVAGKDELKLVVVDESSESSDYANWGNAFLITAPAVTSGAVLVDTPAFAIQLNLNSDFGSQLLPSDFVLKNLDDNSLVPLTAANLQYSPLTRQMHIVFPAGVNIMPEDGNYRLTLDVPNLPDVGGETTAVFFEQDFFILNADANRDRLVDAQDFNLLAGAFGETARVFSQGDFNYSANVDSIDFDIFIAQYGKRVAVIPLQSAQSTHGPFANLRFGTSDRLDLLA